MALTTRSAANPSSSGGSPALRWIQKVIRPAEAAAATSHEFDDTKPSSVRLTLVGPRFALVVLWLLTDYLSRAFDTFLLPFIGFLILPWTTIAFATAQNNLGGLNGIGLLVVILGVLADVGALGGGARNRSF